MARTKKLYKLNFTNDLGKGCFGTFKTRAKAEQEINAIIRHNNYEISIGYANIHLVCYIDEVQA